ncbi:SDR family oxidoreductase [Streptomyces sp. NPDC051207]|uniref:SDR family oxidoreductase n=1 Tax=Streptomyces sp. NPDC051207 TaxID=3154641 RepID=UPI003416F926
MNDLTGRVALVTGGSKGIGKAIARELASRGASIVLNYFHSHDRAKATRDELTAEGHRVDLVRGSVARQEQVDRMFAETDRLHGRLDILVNSAADGALLPLDEITDEHLDRAIEVNYKGGLRCARAAAPLMARGGGGSIVTVSALGGSQMVMANYLACAPAKAAAEAAARYLAVELAPLGIRVNTASAAMLSSEVADKFPQAAQMQDVIARATPWGRLGTPEEFATVVAFLASDDARWITGQVILADGGLTLGAALLSPPAVPPTPPQEQPGEQGRPAPDPAALSAARPTAVPEPAPVRRVEAVAGTPEEPVEPVAAAEGPSTVTEFGDDSIAVVGMGLAVAGANSPEEFWKLRMAGDELFVEVPEDRWQHQSFHSADTAAEDKAYADRCVFITGFQPADGALDGMEGAPDEQEFTTQWLRHSMVQALDGVRRSDTDRCSFVVGYTPDGSQHLEEAGVLAGVTRMTHEIVDDLAMSDDERAALRGGIDDSLTRRYRRGGSSPSRFLPHRVGELAMRGILPASTELHMVDTACSSSLYAIDIAAKGLLMGKQDIAVCGGAFALAPRGTVLFSKLQGLSKSGKVHALDEAADGVIFADGAALVVLKRLSKAQEDGDRVLGVLRAFGSSSDGKGKAIYAPNSAGQSLAVRRALENGDVNGDDVDWINAHATGTPAGDLAEFSTLREHFGTARPTAVTSNKSLIGHTGWAAGVVSLIENLKGLEKRTIPGQYRFTNPREDFRLADTQLDIPSEAAQWSGRGDRPRLAAVSGFGFGGTNAHLIVAENQPRVAAPAANPSAATSSEAVPAVAAPSAAAVVDVAEPIPADAVPAGAALAEASHTRTTAAPAGTIPATRKPDPDSRVAIVGWSSHLPGLADHKEVSGWLAGGKPPLDTFGTAYPSPPFNEVRLPPKTIRALDRCQLMILQCAHRLRDQMPEFWSKQAAKTGVFVGHMGPTRAAMLYANRCYLDDIGQALADSPLAGSPAAAQVLERLREQVRALIPESNEDAFPGQMPNIISARVSNYFDLHGPNMTMDSGFASALSSITSAGRYLRTGELDFALAGGINGNSLPEYRALIGDLLPEQEQQLAEGAFLFALATEERAKREGLPILAYVDEPLDSAAAQAGAVSERDSVRDSVRCTEPEHARYLGAAGGLAVLKALHRPAGTVEVSCDQTGGAPGARLRLTVPGPAAPAGSTPEQGRSHGAAVTGTLPERFLSATNTGEGVPLRVRRQIPVLEATPPRRVREPIPFLPDGALVVTDAPGPLAEAAGPDAALTVLSTAALTAPRPGWHHLPEVTPDAVREALAGAGRPVTHLRVLADLGRSAPAGQSLTEGSPALLALHDAAYLAVQHAYDGLSTAESTLVMLFLDAVPGGAPHPFSGLFTGLLKSAGRELADSTSFALLTSATEVGDAVRLVEEESRAYRDFPVVVDTDGVRRTHRLNDEPIVLGASAPAALDRDSVVVVAGGARGITAEVLKAVAAEFGPRIHVFGSNDLDSYPPSVFAGSDEEFAAGRAAHISAELAKAKNKGKAKGKDTGKRPSVADLNKSFDRMLNARDARRNLDAMTERSGAGRVTYVQCDMRDDAQVEKAIGAVLQEHGRIDLLVNAAGLQRSALIKDKDFAEFTSIRDLKVQSYLNLKYALRDAPPRIWCNFGSLLGYFGQLGESDYASANDFLGSAATYAAATSELHEFTIGWTLWAGVGMGANELTKAYYERAGSYSNMAVPEGVHHFVQELHAPVRRPSLVHLGDAERATVEEFYPGYLTGGTVTGATAGAATSADAVASATGTDDVPPQPQPSAPGFFLRRVVESTATSAVFECRFDLDTDGYLEHHTVRGEPTLPGTFVTEMAAEAARHLVPDQHVVAFEDLRFEHFLRVYRDLPTAPKRLHAQIAASSGDTTTVAVRITEDVVSPAGVVLVKDRVHFTARVLLAGTFPAAPVWEAWNTADDIPVPDPYHQSGSPVRLTGPFVSTTDTRIHPNGKRGRYALSLRGDDPTWQQFTVPSILLDGLARVGVLDLVDGRLIPVAAPLSIRRIDLYEETNDLALSGAGEDIDLYATPPGFDLAADLVDNRFIATRSDGRMLLQMKDMQATLIGYVDARTGEAVPATRD